MAAKKKANPVLDDDEVIPGQKNTAEKTDTSNDDSKSTDNGSSSRSSASRGAGTANAPKRPLIEKIKKPGAGSKDGKPSNSQAALSKDASRMENILQNQDKLPLMIPLGIGEKMGAVKEGWINGFHFSVPKGVMVNVPEGIYELLMSGHELEQNAGQDMLVTRSDDVENALS